MFSCLLLEIDDIIYMLITNITNSNFGNLIEAQKVLEHMHGEHGVNEKLHKYNHSKCNWPNNHSR